MTEMLSAIDHWAQTNGKAHSCNLGNAHDRVWDRPYSQVMARRE